MENDLKFALMLYWQKKKFKIIALNCGSKFEFSNKVIQHLEKKICNSIANKNLDTRTCIIKLYFVIIEQHVLATYARKHLS